MVHPYKNVMWIIVIEIWKIASGDSAIKGKQIEYYPNSVEYEVIIQTFM